MLYVVLLTKLTVPFLLLQVTVEATLEHPFFVFGQGWSSCQPDRTSHRYGLSCHRLSVGDVCISLTHRDVTSRAAELGAHQRAQSRSASSGGGQQISSTTRTPPTSSSSTSSAGPISGGVPPGAPPREASPRRPSSQPGSPSGGVGENREHGHAATSSTATGTCPTTTSASSSEDVDVIVEADCGSPPTLTSSSAAAALSSSTTPDRSPGGGSDGGNGNARKRRWSDNRSEDGSSPKRAATPLSAAIAAQVAEKNKQGQGDDQGHGEKEEGEPSKGQALSIKDEPPQAWQRKLLSLISPYCLHERSSKDARRASVLSTKTGGWLPEHYILLSASWAKS